MADYNQITIVGNVGNEPDMKFTPSGRPVTTFPVAVNRHWTTTDGEQKNETQWFTINTWGKQAESCNQFLGKGRKVLITGRVKLHEWDSENGHRSRIEITAQTVMFLDKINAGNDVPYSDILSDDDDSPF